MKTLIIGLLLILEFSKVRGGEPTNSSNGGLPVITSVSITETEARKLLKEPVFLQLLQNRLLYTTTNAFGVHRRLEFVWEAERLGIDIFDYHGREARNLFKRAGRLALREFALEEVPFIWNAKTSWASIIRNTFTGYEEKHRPVSLFEPKEGMPGQGGIREPRGLKLGWRPLDTHNPQVFATWGKRDEEGKPLFTTSLRLYAEDWKRPSSQLIAQAPILHNMSLAGGLSFRPLDPDKSRFLEARVGLARTWRLGELYIGGTYPAGLSAALSYSW
ncbi:MAG: hypothetical protein Q7S86_02260 [bacterium]|nr:hypothetical protein [bacterium]